MKEGERKWLVLKLACFHVIDIDFSGAFLKTKLNKNELSVSFLQVSVTGPIPKCSSFEAVGTEPTQVCSSGSGGGKWVPGGAVRAEGAQGIRLISPSLIILSVTHFTTRQSLIKMKVVVEEADPIHPNGC